MVSIYQFSNIDNKDINIFYRYLEIYILRKNNFREFYFEMYSRL